MDQLTKCRQEISDNGFSIVDNVFSADEINAIVEMISKADQSNSAFRTTDDLFAIRRFLKEVPLVKGLIFNLKLKHIISSLFCGDYFVVKAIYFDKPKKSNWFVAWHQDITIAVDKKITLPGYGPWTEKPGQYAVQPPLNILQDNFTVRIHLDDTRAGNGALKVIPGSHNKNIYRAENIDWNLESGHSCDLKAGGVMIMRPLLMHASNRTTNNKKRRVIHIEFSRTLLPEQINWAEKEFY